MPFHDTLGGGIESLLLFLLVNIVIKICPGSREGGIDPLHDGRRAKEFTDIFCNSSKMFHIG